MKRLLVVLAFALLLLPGVAAAQSPPATITLTSFSISPNGECVFVFTINGNAGFGKIFPDCQQAIADVEVLQLLEDNVFRFMLAYWAARNPDLSNPNLMLNKTVTIDFSAANAVKVQ